MNFIQLIIQFFVKLFMGGQTQQKKPSPPAPKQPKPTKPTVAPKPKEPEVVEPPKPNIPDMPFTDEVKKEVLKLGSYDDDVSTDSVQAILDLYHQDIQSLVPGKLFLRNGDNFDWRQAQKEKHQAVRTLQTFLVHAGILPTDATIDGIFAYRTQAAVRLFQEYNRNYENKPDLIPDGIVGKTTWGIMEDWKNNKKTASKWTRGMQTAEFTKWINMLKRSKKHFIENNNPIVSRVDEMVTSLNALNPQPVDTLAVNDWTTDPNQMHLIGIRRKEDKSGHKRKNDDFFILLVNGMAFKFWGSTDPNRGKKEAFLVEGQHKFRFGWHNLSKADKLYQGLVPFKRGVLVFRDGIANQDDSLTMEDINKGLDTDPNTTIKIHWTGSGRSTSGTWSAGCQVIAGQSYIDQDGTTINCSRFAALGSSDLKNNAKTKAAYNVFADLILVFRPNHLEHLYYTLGRDETLEQGFLADFNAAEMLKDTINEFDIRGRNII